MSPEENELLTRVGPGTPMGKLFRRFWLPALPSAQLSERDGTPIRLRLLGEDLVAFRDTGGRVGILTPYCAHRGTSIHLGRNEQGGLRCLYHGWKYDVHGRCVDIPNLAADDRLKERIRITAYPVNETGGVVWIYMGPAAEMPPQPEFEWARVPASHRSATVWLHESNWLQGMEGELDSAHVSFLHSVLGDAPMTTARVHRHITTADKTPRLLVKETDYGMLCVARRFVGDGTYYWRATQWMLPCYGMIPSWDWPIGCRGYVPIDDYHTYAWDFAYSPDRPLADEYFKSIESGRSFPPQRDPCVFQLRDGYKIDTWRPRRNRDNDFLADREMQRTVNYSGIYGINDQDRAVQDSMGAICDRSLEHLVATDIAVVTARRRLRALIADVEAGRPVAPAINGRCFNVRPLDAVSSAAELDDVLRSHRNEMIGQAPFATVPRAEAAS